MLLDFILIFEIFQGLSDDSNTSLLGVSFRELHHFDSVINNRGIRSPKNNTSLIGLPSSCRL
jgi:hypothetical protein